jgi:UDP-glucose 4-epimerase
MKVVVTGGAGFIGSHLVDLLLSLECDIVVLDNFSTGRAENLQHVSGKIDLFECDLSVLGPWTEKLKQSDWIFHLAALADIVPSIQQPNPYFRANVVGTLNLLQAAANSSAARFVYAASSSCYGIPDLYPTSEKAEIRPQYPYALTKRMGEELVLHWAQVYKVPAVSTRFLTYTELDQELQALMVRFLGYFLHKN